MKEKRMNDNNYDPTDKGKTVHCAVHMSARDKGMYVSAIMPIQISGEDWWRGVERIRQSSNLDERTHITPARVIKTLAHRVKKPISLDSTWRWEVEMRNFDWHVENVEVEGMTGKYVDDELDEHFTRVLDDGRLNQLREESDTELEAMDKYIRELTDAVKAAERVIKT